MSRPAPARIVPAHPQALSELLSEVISLKLLQFLEGEMQPPHKLFHVVDLAVLVDRYIESHLLQRQERAGEREELLASLPLPPLPRLLPHASEHSSPLPLQVHREESFQLLLEQLKAVFLYYGALSLSYEMVNEYVYNQQLSCLSNGEVDEDYLEIGEKRVRIDENLKLCIMPLAEQGVEVRTTKLRELVFRQNRRGAELESIYVVTSEYVRAVRIQPELIGIASDFHRKGDSQPCWYRYDPELIRPRRSTLSVLSRAEEGAVLSSAELREVRATAATNLEEKFSEQLLSILKASLSENLMGIISLEQSFVVEPIGGKGRVVQGYIGNLVRDVPPEIGLGGQGKEVYEEILLFHSYADTEWLILTSKFLYFYRIPLPAENIILREQNNLNRASSHRPNPLLLLCQRLPKGCVRAMVLRRPFLCLMLESNAVLVIKVVLNSLGVFEGKPLRLEMNYFKITNKVYNDIQFRSMCFHPAFNNIFLSDFGAYLTRITFNPTYGDVEEEGITHDRGDSSHLTQQMIRNSYGELKGSGQRGRGRGVIRELSEEEEGEGEEYIQVYYLKPTREQESHLFSIYKKQSASPHTVIIKNQTRQVITHLAANPNYNTLVTYEAESYEKKTGCEFEGERYREWGNRNKIKLWDIRHMTIYKTYDISIEIAFLELRANGLFAITADRGYLVFYPFNEDRKALMTEAEQRQLDQSSQEVAQELEEVFLERNSLYFSTLTSSCNKYSNLKVHRTHLYQLQLQKYPQARLLQAIPSEISALAVSSRIFVLENSSAGVQASQLHIYNRLGLKEEMMVFSNAESVSAEGKLNLEGYNQEYKHLRRIQHQQFEAVLWNADSLKMIGSSREESYTIIFSSHRVNHFGEGGERIRSIKDIQVVGESMIVYCENTTRLRASGDALSKVSESSERRSREKAGKVQEVVESSLILISNQSDRITYRLEHISPKIKVLHMFNSLVLTREEHSDHDLIKVLDVGDHGPLIEKLLFSAKYRRSTVERVRARDFRGEEFYELQAGRNVLLQELKEYSIRKLITLEDTKIAVTKSNKLLILLVFKVETHYVDLLTRKTLRSELEFMVYTRNISDELFNSNYKISKIQVGKKTEKHLYEYQTSSSRAESIFGHKVLSIDDCYAISNYTEIDMQQLCEAIESEEGRKYAGVDITDKILAPKNINDNHIRDIYEVLSLKRDQQLYRLFQQHPTPVNAINAFSFKIVQFSDEELTGTMAVSNKLLRTISLYTFEVDCRRKNAEKRLDIGEQPEDPYQLQLILEKVTLLEVKSHRDIQREEEIKRSDPSLNRQQIQHINILEWNSAYKSRVEEMWENTVQGLKSFILSEKTKEIEHKRSVSLPPIGMHKLNTLQIKKKEQMKKKLSTSQRNPPDMGPKRLQTEGASLMFKKWTISQGIQLQKSTRDANNITEIKAVNRYVNRVLKSQEDTAERIQQLIINARKIKEVSQMHISMSNTDRQRSITLPSEGDETTRGINVSHLDNIIRSSQIAKQSNIKTYLQQKNLKTITHVASESKQDYTRLSRNQTNKSSLNTEIDKCSAPLRSDSKSDIRLTNMSKMSNNTNLTKRSGKGGHSTPLDMASQGLENKIKLKLQEITDKSASDKKMADNLKFYTPERMKGNMEAFKMGHLKTEKSKYTHSSPSDKQKNIRFATQQTEQPNKSSQYQYTLSISPEQALRSSHHNDKASKFQDYKNNFSLLAYKNKQEQKSLEKQSSSQTEDLKRQLAVQRLKRSQQLMNEVYLPEIASTKEKLMKKMKEKRSYVKTIQAHLNDSSLMTIREGDKRKELIKQLHEFK